MKLGFALAKSVVSLSKKSNLHLLLWMGIILSGWVFCYIIIWHIASIYYNVDPNRINKNGRAINSNLGPPEPLKLSANYAFTIGQESVPHLSYLTTRTRCTQSVFLLIVVFTAPGNIDRRTLIRRTWGSDPSVQPRWKTVFLIGQAANNSIQNKYLEAEGATYKDIIQGSQNEHYYNLVLKTQMGLEWAARYCDFQFLLKTDDDVFINPFNLVEHLQKPDTRQRNLYMGRCKYRFEVRRHGKNGISLEEYNKSHYPPFCNGPAYVLSSDLVSKIVELFDVKKTFQKEDVYVGMLIEKIEGPLPVDHRGFRGRSCEHFEGTFSVHGGLNYYCRKKLFDEAVKERMENELEKLRSHTTRPYN